MTKQSASQTRSHRLRVWAISTTVVAVGLAALTLMTDFWRPAEPSPPMRPSREAVRVGDMNRDGVVDDVDVTLLEDLINADEAATASLINDLNQDGAVDAADVDLLRAFIARRAR